MSTWIVIQRPCLPLKEGLVHEARRAALAQLGATPPSETITPALWLSRALPIALDALSDMRSGLRVDQLSFESSVVESPQPETRAGDLTATALYEVGTDVVEIRFAPATVADERPAREECAAVIHLCFTATSDDDDEPSVNIRRFSVSGDTQPQLPSRLTPSAPTLDEPASGDSAASAAPPKGDAS